MCFFSNKYLNCDSCRMVSKIFFLLRIPSYSGKVVEKRRKAITKCFAFQGNAVILVDYYLFHQYGLICSRKVIVKIVATYNLIKTCKTLIIVVDAIISQELWLHFNLKNDSATTCSQMKLLKLLLIIINNSISTSAETFTWNYLLSVK